MGGQGGPTMNHHIAESHKQAVCNDNDKGWDEHTRYVHLFFVSTLLTTNHNPIAGWWTR